MYGALLERGRVINSTDGRCGIESYCRAGVTTPPLPLLNGLEVELGDRVLFFMFDDGTGIVIARMEDDHGAANP